MIDEALLQNLASAGLLFAMTCAVLERVVLVIPSYVVFVIMGTALVNNLDDLIVVVLVSSVGSTIGAVLWYAIGVRLGEDRCRRFIARYQKWLFFSVARYNDLAGRFRTNSWLVMIVSQTIPTVRIFVAMPAGVIGIKPWAFLLATFLGCLVWNGSLITASFLFKDSDWDSHTVILAIVVGLLVIEGSVYLAYRYFSRWVVR